MSDALSNIAFGLGVATMPSNLLFAFIGCLLGTLIGVLPGIGPVATVALLLPVTFYLEPVTGLVMLAGIYYGAQYGGSTTSVLMNLPGEASSVVTCLDGHQMARQGRAGSALAIAALASFFAGCVITLAIAIFSPLMARIALSFTPTDYFSLMLFGLVASVVLAQGSLIKAVGMVMLGLFLGSIGTDINSGLMRYTFGSTQLMDGLDFTAVAMGLFGVGEVLANLRSPQSREFVSAKIGRLWPSREDFQRSWKPAVRGTFLGGFLGVLPGGGALLSSFASYAVEKKLSRHPERFGTGMIEGVAGPEAANNAGAQSSFIPLLTLGIPGNSLTALMVGAMMIQGITPGPQVLTQQPDLVWGLIASMWVGNVMLLVINLPLIGVWVSLLRVPYRLLFPCILVLIGVGAYGIGNDPFDILVVAVFGLVGFVLRLLDCEPAPLILGFILGPMIEQNLMRSLIVSDGDWSVFFTNPVSLAFLLLATGLLLMYILPTFRRQREAAFREE